MILIVDDKPENLFSLKKTLEQNAFEVDTAASGDEALKKILKRKYAIAILDVQMPGMDGFEVARIISGHSQAKDMSIIFLSAVNTDKSFVKKGYASGAVDYVVKPVDPDVLMLKVKTFYRLYQQHQELQEARRALEEEVEIRKQAEKQKDEFMSIASHELKTPLTSITAYLQLLENTIDDPSSEAYIFLQRALSQSNKLHSLIKDFLDTSRIESGKLQLNKREFDFSNLLANAVDLISKMHPSKKIFTEGVTDILVYGDEMRLEQVLVNYLTNAIKYSPEAKEVKVRCEIHEDQLTVQVIDQGIGIPKARQKKLFEKFYRVDEASVRFEGLGMGLFICKEIITRHDGMVGVESEVGQGSVFYFRIPVRKEKRAEVTE